MRVRLLEPIVGTRNGVRWPPKGSVVDLPDLEALDLCKTGIATPVRSDGDNEEKRQARKRAGLSKASTGLDG